jgi:hypothetical protein
LSIQQTTVPVKPHQTTFAKDMKHGALQVSSRNTSHRKRLLFIRLFKKRWMDQLFISLLQV